MSKSKGNVIDPLEVIESGYGADTLRTYEMFIGPYDQDAAWDTKAIGGVYRFLNRCWTLCFAHDIDSGERRSSEELFATNGEQPKRSSTHNDGLEQAGSEKKDGRHHLMLRHKTIKKVTTDLYRQSFNTAVAALMEYVNELYKTPIVDVEDIVALAKLLKPFAPHLASEMLEHLGAGDVWPTWDEKYLVSDEFEIVVQVNGKLRARLSVAADKAGDADELQKLALEDGNVQKFVSDREIRKVIIPKGAKLINIVV